MKIARRLDLAAALPTLLFVQARSSAVHEGVADTDPADPLGRASTSIDLSARYAGAEVEAAARLAAGTAKAVFSTPDGRSAEWNRGYGEGTTAIGELSIGCRTTAAPGTCLLAIMGSADAIGGYELSLCSHP